MCAPDDLFLKLTWFPTPPHTLYSIHWGKSQGYPLSKEEEKRLPLESSKEGGVDDPNVHWKQSRKVPQDMQLQFPEGS